MASSVCINHTERPATARCLTCHKPVCEDCVVRSEDGTFCSAECVENYQAFHRRYQPEAAPGFWAQLKGWLASLSTLVLLAGLAAIGIYAGAKLLKIGFCQAILKKFGL